MVVLTLLGAGAMVGHHYFCQYLDGKEVNTDPLLGMRFSEQALIGVTGNAIASIASFVFGTAIGIVFVQVLWSSLRNKGLAIEHVQAVMECRTSPFSPSALYAWRAATKLTLLALLSAAMTLVTIFAPSALRTEAQTTVTSKPCTIPTVDMSGGTYGTYWPNNTGQTIWTPSPDMKRMVAQNLMSGSYITPPSPCGSCAYNLTFNAPAMTCSNTSNEFNFSGMLSPLPDLFIWNCTHDIYENGNTLNIATVEGYGVNMQAAACQVFNTSYTVEVFHNGTSTEVKVINAVAFQPVSAMDPSAPDKMAIYTIALATAQMLYGLGRVDLNTMENIIDTTDALDYNPYFYVSKLGEPGAPGSKKWQWEPGMVEALPQLVMNVSISMLSNPLNAPMVNIETQCRFYSIVYVYDELHLAVAYGSGLLVTVVCVLFGFLAVKKNGREESLGFSRLLVAILTPDLYTTELNKEVRIRATNQPGPQECSKFTVDRNNISFS